MLVQVSLCRTWSETTLLVLPRSGSNICYFFLFNQGCTEPLLAKFADGGNKKKVPYQQKLWPDRTDVSSDRAHNFFLFISLVNKNHNPPVACSYKTKKLAQFGSDLMVEM